MLRHLNSLLMKLLLTQLPNCEKKIGIIWYEADDAFVRHAHLRSAPSFKTSREIILISLGSFKFVTF